MIHSYSRDTSTCLIILSKSSYYTFKFLQHILKTRKSIPKINSLTIQDEHLDRFNQEPTIKKNIEKGIKSLTNIKLILVKKNHL